MTHHPWLSCHFRNPAAPWPVRLHTPHPTCGLQRPCLQAQANGSWVLDQHGTMYNITAQMPTSYPQHSSFDNTAVLMSCPQHNSFGTTAVPTCCPQHNNFGTTAVLTSDPQLNSISAAGMMGSGPGIAPWAFPGPAQQLAGAPVQSFEQPQYTPDPWDRFMSQSSTQESMQTPPDSFDLAGVDCADLNLDDVNWDEMFPGV